MIPKHNLVTVYPLAQRSIREGVCRKVENRRSWSRLNYWKENKKAYYQVNEEGSEEAKKHGTWMLIPEKHKKSPMAHLINCCWWHKNVKVEMPE